MDSAPIHGNDGCHDRPCVNGIFLAFSVLTLERAPPRKRTPLSNSRQLLQDLPHMFGLMLAPSHTSSPNHRTCGIVSENAILSWKDPPMSNSVLLAGRRAYKQMSATSITSWFTQPHVPCPNPVAKAMGQGLCLSSQVSAKPPMSSSANEAATSPAFLHRCLVLLCALTWRPKKNHFQRNRFWATPFGLHPAVAQLSNSQPDLATGWSWHQASSFTSMS